MICSSTRPSSQTKAGLTCEIVAAEVEKIYRMTEKNFKHYPVFKTYMYSDENNKSSSSLDDKTSFPE